VLPGIVGSLQANEAIKLILGIGDSLVGRFSTLIPWLFAFVKSSSDVILTVPYAVIVLPLASLQKSRLPAI